MRKLYSIVASLIITISVYAQAPQQFSYQAVVRGVNNELLVNKTVGMRISLLQDSATGNAVYIETHTPFSNANGLVSIAIGNGKVVNGTFANIDWSKGPYFVKTETDITGGAKYTLSNINQLLSVPYALFSANDKDEQKLSVSSTGDTLYLQNGGYVIIPGISSAQPKPTPTSGYGPNITDIDGNTYKTVYIGTQHWMAENLKVSKYNNGTTIPNVTDDTQWNNLTTDAWCYYNNDANKNTSYGKLYNWNVVNKSNVCPLKWRLPTYDEWTVLANYLGGENIAGSKMKDTSNIFWSQVTPEKFNNISLFTGIPGGSRSNNGSFWDLTENGRWWSSTESNTYYAWARQLNYGSNFTRVNSHKGFGLSIRCIKD